MIICLKRGVGIFKNKHLPFNLSISRHFSTTFTKTFTTSSKKNQNFFSFESNQERFKFVKDNTNCIWKENSLSKQILNHLKENIENKSLKTNRKQSQSYIQSKFLTTTTNLLNFSQSRNSLRNNTLFSSLLSSQFFSTTKTKTNLPEYPMDLFASRDYEKTVPSKKLKEKLDLTPQEVQIFNALLETLKHFKLNTVLRAAGGWVRDKLLGHQSSDIDIAIDNMTGQQFADKVNEYLKLKGYETHEIGVIAINPEQSKHLETATTKVFGLSVDFVNLRKESYGQSRIPTIEFGTAEEDALRRDITINALFYNLNTGSIEDFSKKGIFDLERAIIRTPLEPFQTLMDDPLRALRVVRFAAKMESRIVPELADCIKNPQLHQALVEKVSRERIGKEFKAMCGYSPIKIIRSIALFHILNLDSIVFTLPQKLETPEPLGWRDFSLRYSFKIGRLLERENSILKLNSEELKTCILAAYCFPISKLRYKPKNKSLSVLEFLFIESLKWGHEEADFQKKIAEGFDMLRDVLFGNPELAENSKSEMIPFSRKLVGLALRKLGKFWKIGCALSLMHFVPLPDPIENYFKQHPWEYDGKGVAQRVHDLFKFVEVNQLDGVWNMNPILGGDQILSSLPGLAKTEIPKIKDEIMEWQLENPSKTSSDCITWLVQKRSQKQ